MCDKDNSNLQKLEILTDSLKDNIPVKSEGSYKEYDTIKGCAIAFGLKNRPSCAVADVRITPDGIVDWHTHDETEFLIVYEGSLEVEVKEGESTKLVVTDFIKLPPGTAHRVRSLGATVKLIAITIPSSILFPKVTNG